MIVQVMILSHFNKTIIIAYGNIKGIWVIEYALAIFLSPKVDYMCVCVTSHINNESTSIITSLQKY